MPWSTVRREFITSLRTAKCRRRLRRNLFDRLPLFGSYRSIRAEELARRHDRPGDARKLVGERHGDEPSWSALEKLARSYTVRVKDCCRLPAAFAAVMVSG